MNTKHPSNTAAIAAELTGIDSMPEQIAEHERATRLVSALSNTRVRKGLTQKAVAERMHVSVSTVSRFEDSRDSDVRFGDLVAYSAAVGVNLSVLMEDSGVPVAARIKNCVLLVSDGLRHLSRLAADSHGDRDMIDGINRFRGEVLYNFLVRYLETGDAMPRISFAPSSDDDLEDDSSFPDCAQGVNAMVSAGEIP